MKRAPSFKKSIVRLDGLLARYASRPGLLDALNARAILGDGAPSLTELALAHLRREKGRGRAVAPLTLRELFDRRLARFSPAQKRSAEAVRVAARHFCRALGAETPVEALDADAIRAALGHFRAPRTYNSYLQQIRTALSQAVKDRELDASPAAGLAPKRVDWTEPAFLPPDRVERIFRILEAHPGAVESGIGAHLALGFFAGVRTAEILRARWEDLDLDGRVLRIPRPKGFTKGRRPRLVELEPNAAAWLRLWRDWTAKHAGAAAGRIVRDEHDIRNWKALRLAPEGLSWGNDAAHRMPSAKPERNAKGDREAWPPRTGRSEAIENCRSGNAARHTYATMHVAAFRAAAATAINLGHIRGTDLLDRHYRGLVPQAVAKTYWDIRPSREPAPPEPLPGRGYRSDLKASRRDERGACGARLCRPVLDREAGNATEMLEVVRDDGTAFRKG